MWLSSTAQTALRAVIHLASAKNSAPIRAGEVARAIGAPQNYLSKTLHALARAGVLTSRRGPEGGFVLAVPADALRLDRVIAPFAAVGDRRCLMGRAGCGTTSHCMAHDRWSKVAAEVERFLATTTIADLLVNPVTPGSPPAHLTLEESTHARASR